MQLSIVTTLYYSEQYIREFYRRTRETAELIAMDYEFIFVNDGSPDGSLKAAVDLHREDQRVKIIDLSRNFGHHRAMMTGLKYATGDRVFLIDVDLEEDPELLETFWKKMDSEDNGEVVYGVRR